MLTDEQIDDAQESAYRALVAKGYNGGMGGFQWDRASARAIERAAIKAYQSQQGATEAHFDLWQDDMVVASAFGPRDRALAEIQHYAAVYGQDGPVQIEEVIRMPISALTPPPEAP